MVVCSGVVCVAEKVGLVVGTWVGIILGRLLLARKRSCFSSYGQCSHL